jgi:hypothetical protein
VEKDLRASLVAAGAAAALSALVGVIAGVGFLVLLLRAVVGGLAIGAIAYLGILFLRKTLPGAAGSAEASAAAAFQDAADEAGIGANVDIVLPEEPAEVEGLGAAPAPKGPAPAKAGAAAEADYLEEASLLEPDGLGAEAAIPTNAGAEDDGRPSPGFDELDVLPDLDGFTDAFTASEFASGGSAAAGAERGAYARGSGGGSSSPRAGQEGLDPATLAQAVRTILKRDQKG